MDNKDTKIAALASTQHALELCQIALAQYPKYNVYAHAVEQLDKMLQILNSGPSATNDLDQNNIDIGLMATRELIDDEPKLATALLEADHNFRLYINSTKSI